MESRVKGSPAYKVGVVRYRPAVVWVVTLLVIALLAMSFAIVYRMGVGRGIQDAKHLEEEVAGLQAQLSTANVDLDELRRQRAALQVDADVDGRAAEEVRVSVRDLQRENAELRDEISFYKGLMAPNELQEGVGFRSAQAVPMALQHNYELQIIVQQIAVKHELVDGSFTIRIDGLQAYEENGSKKYRQRSLNHADLGIDEKRLRLRFKYFQKIVQTLVLPEGFEPASVALSADAKNGSIADARFDWVQSQQE